MSNLSPAALAPRIERIALLRPAGLLQRLGDLWMTLVVGAAARFVWGRAVRVAESGDQLLIARHLERSRASYARHDAPPRALLNEALGGLQERAARAGPARVHWLEGERLGGDGVLLYVPGGSFIIQRSPRVTALIGRLAKAAGLRVCIVDYRLAPEHPYPAAIEDVTAAILALVEEGHAPDRIVLASESAGCAIALSALNRLRPRGITLAAGVLFSPWTDLALTGWSMVARGLTGDSPFSMELSAFCVHLYLQGKPPFDPDASPAYADLSGLPPLLIHTSSMDLFHDDACALADRAAKAGVEATLRVWPRGAHVWERFFSAEGERSILQAAAFLRAKLGLPTARDG